METINVQVQLHKIERNLEVILANIKEAQKDLKSDKSFELIIEATFAAYKLGKKPLYKQFDEITDNFIPD